MLKRYLSNLIYSLIAAAEFCIIFELTVHLNNTKHQIIILCFIAFVLTVIFNAVCTCCPSFGIKKKIIFAVIAPALYAIFLIIIFAISHFGYVPNLDTGKDNLFSDKKVMIIVPHQDDEVLLCGGIIENYINGGSDVTVAFSTSGDYNGISEWRMEETLSVMNYYGIDEADTVFLGYGNEWPEEHIYNSAPDKERISANGADKTFGLSYHPAYHDGQTYTRNNLKNDIKSLVSERKPDVIYCIDCDAHGDHIGTSLIFEEALGELLSQPDNKYYPIVYKGFAYSNSLKAVDDYSAVNIKSTQNPYTTPFMQETNVYNWSDRVRMPISSTVLSSNLNDNGIYRALKLYVSQTVINGAGKSANGDRVFWKRRTDSLIYGSKITASSGNPKCLNDFKIFDSNDVRNFEDGFFRGTGVWIANSSDEEKNVHIELPKKQKISCLVLYDNPSLNDNINNAVVVFDDGTKIQTGKLNPNGSGTVVDFDEKAVSSIDIYIIESEGDKAGLTETEVYSSAEFEEASYIKLMNEEDDFIYNYVIDESGGETFKIYRYGCNRYSENEIYCNTNSEKCSAELSGDTVTVKCPHGETCFVTVGIKDTDISDTVYIMNPDSTRLYTAAQKINEWKYDVFNFSAQKRYLKDLIR